MVRALTEAGILGVVISLAEGKSITADTEDFEPSPDLIAENQKRQSPCEHEVSRYGIQTVRPYSRGGSTA
ncbi:hypothetical protein GCM10023238_05100 [Streptomyces heliomycini]